MLAVVALLGLVSVIHEAPSTTEVRELFSYWEKEVNCDIVRTSDLDGETSALLVPANACSVFHSGCEDTSADIDADYLLCCHALGP